jgi:hypothetical protein
MQNRFIRHSALLLGLVVLIGMCVVDAGAQSRRKRRVRRPRVVKPVVKPVITNPAIAPPGSEQTPEGERIISTADGSDAQPGSEDTAAETKSSKNPAKTKDGDLRQTVNTLSDQVDRLNDKLTQMQQNERTSIDMERLTRAEQRAESLRGQQVDVESKLADLESKLDQIEYLLRPENIDRAAGYGTLHPEEARDARRKQLENERTRVKAQAQILETSKARLETSLRTADAEVDSLRRKIELQQAQQDTSGTTTTEPRPRRAKPE